MVVTFYRQRNRQGVVLAAHHQIRAAITAGLGVNARPFRFRAALVVTVNHYRSEINLHKLMFVLVYFWLPSSPICCFYHSAPNVRCIEPAKVLLGLQLYGRQKRRTSS